MFGDLIHSGISQGQQNLAEQLKKRRVALSELIAQTYPDKKGSIVLLAPMEYGHHDFLQDSSFYYFSGINEPSAVLTWSISEPTTLYQPEFGTMRAKWIHCVDPLNEDFQKFKLVKELLYDKKFTLAGAKNELENMKKNKNVIATHQEKPVKPVSCDCKEKLAQIRQELLKVKQAL